MLLENIEGLSKGSHKLISVKCDFSVSKKCRGEYKNTYRDVLKYRENNNGKDICLFCSRKLKYSGRNNPNCQYKKIDDNYFNSIDSKEKAYILGWIGSDGSISTSGFRISVHIKDKYMLNRINKVFNSSKVKTLLYNMCFLTVSSKQIAKRLKEIFGLPEGIIKKSDILKFPKDLPEEYFFDFLRGYFDGDGSIRLPSIFRKPECAIYSNSINMLEEIQKKVNIPSHIYKNEVYWNGVNALDFLGKLYDTESYWCLERKKQRFLQWSSYIEGITNYDHFNKINIKKDIICKYKKIEEYAIAPYKKRISDSGFDLSLSKLLKKEGNYYYYDTGLQIIPSFGWYLDIVPRSSLTNTGFILANSVGIIDRSYRGSVKIVLIKIDSNKPDLILPYRAVQMIPRIIVHPQLIEIIKDEKEEVEGVSYRIDTGNIFKFFKKIWRRGFIVGNGDNNTIDETVEDYDTERGEKGFGSTGI